MRFRFSSAGESHGAAILALVEGVPFGLELDVGAVDRELLRRQAGFGRSARMQLEQDRVAVVAGLYRGRTSGAPLALRIDNRDASLDALPPLHRPRPGHADLAGAMRFAATDARPILERASARETAARVAAGAVARQVLATIGVRVEAFVVAIGGVAADPVGELERAVSARDASDVACADVAAAERMRAAIRDAGRAGDTLGGVVEVHATGVPAGLGSLMQWDSRLDARVGAAMLSIPSAKGVEIGSGFAGAALPGSRVHDPIGGGGRRPTNSAGGVEGGMTAGGPIVVRVAFKPLATLKQPLPSIDLRTGEGAEPDPQRSDVCAVPSAAVVAEAMLLLVLADCALESFGGTTIDAFRASASAHATRLRTAFPWLE